MSCAASELDSFRRLVKGSIQLGKDFPLSTMSETLLQYLWQEYEIASAPLCALDVGTGSGVHALALAMRGFRVTAIDIDHGCLERLNERLSRTFNFLTSQVRPSHMDLARLPIDGHEYDLVVFNPPAYFSYVTRGVHTSPASGVFVPEGRNLMRELVVKLPSLLGEGGSFIATWPGLPRMLVETSEGHVGSPQELIQEWIGNTFKIQGPQGDLERFWSRVAVIDNDYGVGPSFLQDLEMGFKFQRYSSSYSKWSDPETGGYPNFRFGILHLRREGKSLFRVLPTWKE